MDLDDKVLHYLLLLGGMLASSLLHHLADLLGWDTFKWLRKLVRTAKKS